MIAEKKADFQEHKKEAVTKCQQCQGTDLKYFPNNTARCMNPDCGIIIWACSNCLSGDITFAQNGVARCNKCGNTFQYQRAKQPDKKK